MSKFKVEVLQRAVFELRDIYNYINQDNPTASKKILNAIFKAIEDLAIFPHRGSSLDADDAILVGWRFLVVKPYLIFYKLNNNLVTVYHILDGRRDYLEILKVTK